MREFRTSRVDRALSLADVGAATGISASEMSRIERGLVPSTSLARIVQLHAVVGNDVALQVYPGGSPIRDAGHAALLASFRARLHPTWRWATEVPLPIPGDKRAWDALAWLPTCRYGVEAEMAPTDAQALVRRLQLKLRDGGVDGILLVLPDTRRVRAFLVAAQPELAPLFPVAGRRALDRLEAGANPGGSAVILLARPGGCLPGRLAPDARNRRPRQVRPAIRVESMRRTQRSVADLPAVARHAPNRRASRQRRPLHASHATPVGKGASDATTRRDGRGSGGGGREGR